MKKIYLALISSLVLSAYAQPEKIKEKLRVYEHENKGCPINSICSEKNGARMLEWERILEKSPGPTKIEDKKKFFENNGVPIHFLSKKSLSESQDVILSASRCRIHNPKNPFNALYKGTIFSNKIPSVDGMYFDEIHVFKDKEPITYNVAHEGKPYFIKDKRLFFLEDFEDNFYQISIGMKGDIKLEDLPQRLFGQSQSKRINDVPCPESKKAKEDRYNSTYCQKIWNIDTNEMVTIQTYWSCP